MHECFTRTACCRFYSRLKSNASSLHREHSQSRTVKRIAVRRTIDRHTARVRVISKMTRRFADEWERTCIFQVSPALVSLVFSVGALAPWNPLSPCSFPSFIPLLLFFRAAWCHFSLFSQVTLYFIPPLTLGFSACTCFVGRARWIAWGDARKGSTIQGHLFSSFSFLCPRYLSLPIYSFESLFPSRNIFRIVILFHSIYRV